MPFPQVVTKSHLDTLRTSPFPNMAVPPSSAGADSSPDVDAIKVETVLGHKQELKRNFGLFSLTGLGFVVAKCVYFCTPVRIRTIESGVD